MLEPGSKGPAYNVGVTLSVTEGDQYSLSSINWSGNQAISTTELAKVFGMSSREVLPTRWKKSTLALHNALRVYNSNGYINARVLPTADLDDASAKCEARRLLAGLVMEGSQYHMGSVTFERCVSEHVASDILSKQWKLKPGDIYDSAYCRNLFPRYSTSAQWLKNVPCPGTRPTPPRRRLDQECEVGRTCYAAAPQKVTASAHP